MFDPLNVSLYHFRAKDNLGGQWALLIDSNILKYYVLHHLHDCYMYNNTILVVLA